MSNGTNDSGGTLGLIRRNLQKIGIQPALALGYLGVLIFMIGDAVELGYLSPYLIDHGLTQSQSALVFTSYGAVVAIGAWLTGPLCQRFGPRKVMTTGVLIWIVPMIVFLSYALPTGDFETILLSYTLRGFGYPFFAYGFLIWIAATTPNENLGQAMGWFWFCFALGLPTIGSVVANVSIPILGEYYTFWAELGLVSLGALIGLLGTRDPVGREPLTEDTTVVKELSNGISILWRDTRVLAGGIVRIIDTAPQFGFFIILPTFFVQTVGISQSQWLFLLTVLSTANVICNLMFGYVSDWFGWRRTITLFGGIGCALTTLALYYGPTAAQQNYLLMLFLGALYGVTLAGYLPLSAIMPAMVGDNDTGNSMAILNFSAGLASSVGPAIVGVTLAPLGPEGVMVIFAGLYVVSAILSWIFLKDPSDPRYSAVASTTPTPADDD